MSNRLPVNLSPCAVNMLARPEWFADPRVISRARLAEATGLPRLLSSRLFARQEIGAITLGHTIYLRRIDNYEPHTAAGLAFLAHELKHVEQFEREGVARFYSKYIWAYVFHGYGESVPFEAEAYEFQRQVLAHLTAEFEGNLGRHPCREMAEPHTPSDLFVKTAPATFRYPQ